MSCNPPDFKQDCNQLSYIRFTNNGEKSNKYMKRRNKTKNIYKIPKFKTKTSLNQLKTLNYQHIFDHS